MQLTNGPIDSESPCNSGLTPIAAQIEWERGSLGKVQLERKLMWPMLIWQKAGADKWISDFRIAMLVLNDSISKATYRILR